MINKEDYEKAKEIVKQYEQEQLTIPVVSSSKWTIERLYEVVTNPNLKNGCDIHLKHLWENNGVKSIFTITGLDVSHLIGDRPDTSGIRIKDPRISFNVIY